MSEHKKRNNELAIVHAANRIMLEDINSTVEKTKKELKILLDEVNKLPVDNIDVENLELPLNEINEPLLDNQSVNAALNQDKINNLKQSITPDWDSIVQVSKKEIADPWLNPDQLFLYDLLSPEENIAIHEYLNRPLYERISWDKWDYVFAFGIGLTGGIFDIFLGTPGFGLQKQMVDKTTWVGSQMEKIHNLHPGGATVDYQGKKFGGAYHRGLSPGHDLFQVCEGIRQFKDGEFRGWYWVNGKKYFFESSVNQFGKDYEPMCWGEAVLAWMTHMFCDFFSTTSLPIPVTSYLYGIDNRELRVFVEKDLYQRYVYKEGKRINAGINLRHLVLQTIAPLSIEVIIRCYIFFRYHKQTIDQDALEQKKLELLTIGHAVSTGFNLGKIYLTKDPLLINIPQIVALSKTLMKLVLQEYNRNSFYGKVQRNLKDLRQTQQQYEYLIEKGLSENIILQ